MKKGLGVVGLLAIPLLLVVMGKRKANAASGESEAMPADIGAQYLAALQHNIASGGSFEEYHRILAEAASKNVFDPAQQTSLLGKHPDAPQYVKDNATQV